MRKADYTLTFALCISLVLHGMGFFSWTAWYTHSLLWWMGHGNWPRQTIHAKTNLEATAQENVEGMPGGIGTAFNSSPGDQPMRAWQADSEQAFVSHDPFPNALRGLGDLPAGNPDASSGAKPLTELLTTPKEKLLIVALPTVTPTNLIGRSLRDVKPELLQTAIAVASVQPPAAPSNPAEESHATGRPGQVGMGGHGADGGVKGQAESDPFSVDHADVAYINGKVRDRNGRVKKSYRVYLSAGGEFAVRAIYHPRVVLWIKIDENGKVVDVEPIKSSGSIDIDNPSIKTMYNWEFTVKRDANGKIIDDEFSIPFVFYEI